MGVTNDLVRWVFEHKQGVAAGCTGKYKVPKRVYHETATGSRTVIARENN